MTTECAICCEKYNKSNRKKIICKTCNFEACNKCCETYLLSLQDDPHCMSCKARWTNMFMFENFTKTFNNKKHKDHKKDNLMDLERAKMPATMPYIEKEQENIEISKEIEIQRQKIELMEEALRAERHKVYVMSNQIRENEDFIKGRKSMKIEKREFIKACPAEGCKGFLSTSWKCGACSIWVCKHCEEIIGKDKNAEHVCDENKKKSIAFIKKSTKPCPSCGTSISKISGCDQMWCTGCKVAFSWNTGRKINGTIHNPHYFEYMQRSNTAGHVNQQPGAILCGGLPYHQYFVRILTECLVEVNGFDKDSAYCLKERIMSLYRISGEIRENILDKYREDIQNNDNLQYRIRFIKKEIDEKDFKKNIMRKKKSLDFKQEVLHIYELFNVVLVETVRDIYESLNELPHQVKETVSTRYDRYYGRDVRRSVRCREIKEQHVTGYINKLVEHFNKVNDLALYCNDELFKISTAYNLQVLVIPDLVNNPVYLKVKNNMLDVKESAKQVFDAENIFLWCKHRGPYCRDTRGYKSTGKYKEKFPNFNPVIREFYESEKKRWEENEKQKNGSWVGRPNILNLL